MLYNDHVFIPTDKFYTAPAFAAYDEVKQAHLQATDAEYNGKSTKDKWALLIDRLSKALQSQAFTDILTGFKTKRESTPESDCNLSLQQCVTYFEDFYFLYTTTDTRFKLTSAAKKSLLNSIRDVVSNVCETGINGQFYKVLQDHKKDVDWIKDALTKARCATLLQLKSRYVAEHRIGSNYDVHVYDYMVSIANTRQLGIPIEVIIRDAFAGALNQRQIDTYFNTHAPRLFEAYEKEVTSTLINEYLLSKFIAIFHIDSVAWNNNTVTLSFEHMRDLQRSIEIDFHGIPAQEVLNHLGELSEDCLSFTLKKKSEVALKIGNLVTQKLIADEYYVSLDDVAENRQKHQNLRLKNGTNLDDLIKLHQALKNADAQALHSNPRRLINYSELILAHIKSNSVNASLIPRWLKMDTRFMDASMTVFDERLCDAIARGHDEDIRAICAQLFNFIQAEDGYLAKLSTLVKTNARFIDLVKEAERHLLPAEMITFLLSTTRDISSHDMLTYVNQVASGTLLNIIDTRRDNNLPPLPFSKEISSDLQQFIQEIDVQLQPDWSAPHLDLKRKACEKEDFAFIHDSWRTKNALTFLATTDNWFTAFRQYHAYQTSAEKRVLLLMGLLCAMRDVVLSILNVVLSLLKLFVLRLPLEPDFTDLFSPMLTAVITAYICLVGILYGMEYLVSTYITNSSVLNNIVAGIAEPFWFYIRHLDVARASVYFAVVSVALAVQALGPYLMDTFDMVKALLKTLANSFAFDAHDNIKFSLEEACDETISRLEGRGEASAQEKNEVLKAVYSQAKGDVTPDNSLKACLDKRYKVSYRGRDHDVSFSDVASTRRGYFSSFSLEPQTAWMSFFSRQTTTEHILASVSPLAGMA